MTTQTSTGFGNSFSSNITVQGKQLLEQRLVHLRTVERDHIAQLFQIAASEGDLSENAGYDDAREQSFRLEKQIADLERYLDSAVLVGANLFEARDKIQFGSIALLQASDGRQERVMIDSELEVDTRSNPNLKLISDLSPLGKALIQTKAKIGSIVNIKAPKGNIAYSVLEVQQSSSNVLAGYGVTNSYSAP